MKECHVLTPLSEYAKDKRTKDGHGCYCRKCVRIRSANHYQKNKEKVKAQHREWVKNNPGKMTDHSVCCRASGGQETKNNEMAD